MALALFLRTWVNLGRSEGSVDVDGIVEVARRLPHFVHHLLRADSLTC